MIGMHNSKNAFYKPAKILQTLVAVKILKSIFIWKKFILVYLRHKILQYLTLEENENMVTYTWKYTVLSQTKYMPKLRVYIRRLQGATLNQISTSNSKQPLG
jgi:hypothetical protein